MYDMFVTQHAHIFYTTALYYTTQNTRDPFSYTPHTSSHNIRVGYLFTNKLPKYVLMTVPYRFLNS